MSKVTNHVGLNVLQQKNICLKLEARVQFHTAPLKQKILISAKKKAKKGNTSPSGTCKLWVTYVFGW